MQCERTSAVLSTKMSDDEMIVDSEALCELASSGNAEQLARVLDALGREEACRLVKQRQRRGPHQGMHAMLVAGGTIQVGCRSCCLMLRSSTKRPLLAMHIAEKSDNTGVAQVLARASEGSQTATAAVTSRLWARPRRALQENFRTYSKLYRDPAAFEVLENEVLGVGQVGPTTLCRVQ